MAQVFSISDYQRRKTRPKLIYKSAPMHSEKSRIDRDETSLSRLAAKELIRQASGLLAGLGQGERRVGWMLDDCLDLLLEQERDEQQKVCPESASPALSLNRCSPQGLHDNGVEFAPLVRSASFPLEDAAQ